MLLRKPRSYAECINDLDGEIVNAFRVLRTNEQAKELEQLLRLTPFSRKEFIASYHPSDDPVEQARRTIARSFMGYGTNSINTLSGFRNDTNRSGTTPAHDWMHYPDYIKLFTERLQGVVIESLEAQEIIKKFDRPDTLFYIDPPYVHSTRGARHRYRYEMTNAEHGQLADVLHNVLGHVVISGYDSILYNELYSDWYRAEKSAMADGARKRLEILWITPHSAQEIRLDF